MVFGISLHPFKEGIYSILKQHFDDSIVKKFRLDFEIDVFNPNYAENVWKQKKDNNLILEVRYVKPDGTTEFICDVYSWESKAKTTAHLLRHITDKVKSGAIGKDWFEQNGKIAISEDIVAGKLETPDDPMNFEKLLEKAKKNKEVGKK